MEVIELDLTALPPGKESYSVQNGNDPIFLKKTALSAERLNFVHGAKEYLYSNGFKYLDRFVGVNAACPFIELDGALYTAVHKQQEPRECDFDKREDMGDAADLLARLHKAGRGFSTGLESDANNNLGKLPMHFRKRYDEIKKLYKQAKKGRSHFDFMFLECAPALFRQCEETIEGLERSAYADLVAENTANPVISHHDYTYQNLAYQSDELYIMNFDYCCFELKVYDVANLLRRKMRKCNWQQEEAGYILTKYRAVEPITPEEFEVMKLILQFPQKFWRVLNRYYNSRKSWAEKGYIAKLREVAEELEFSAFFLENLDKSV